MRGILILYALRGSRVGAAPRTLTTLADAAKDSHLGGIPRRMILTTVGGLTKLYGILLNDTKVRIFLNPKTSDATAKTGY